MTNKSDRHPDGGSRKGRSAKVLPACLEKLFTDHQQRSLLMLLLALLLTFVLLPRGGFIPGHYAPGDIATRDVKAPRDQLIPDQSLTDEKRQAAAQAILPLHDFDPRTSQELIGRIMALIAQAGQMPDAEQESVDSQTDHSTLLEELSSSQRRQLVRWKEKPDTAVRLRLLLEPILSRFIVGNLEVFETGRGGAIVVRDLGSHEEKTLTDTDQVIGIDEALVLLGRHLRQSEHWDDAEGNLLINLVKRLLRPNLTFNQSETEERRQLAREQVKPVLLQIKRGEMLVREGERVTEDQILKIKALRGAGGWLSGLLRGAGLFIGILLLLFVGHRFAQRNVTKYRPKTRDLLFLVLVFVGLFVFVKLAIFMAAAMETAFPYIDSTSYYYALPFAAGAMLVRIVLNSEVALVFALIFSVLLGVMFGNNLYITLYALAGSLTAAHFVRHCLARSALYQAGLQLSLVNVLLVLSLHLMAGNPLTTQLLYKAGFGFIGGFFCAVLVTGLVPLAENLFKYTTDIKLLELANMNTPALRELMIQAPGTYHHSIIVGNLAEAAAETIGANPLMARVAAYYHDIGKTRKPLYFVENIGAQENRHDKLSPSMSALILMSHVKDGVDTARACNLGEELVEIIRQHHGTALMKFFFEKAKKQTEAAGKQVEECDYRYPGPKPQTREAALIMLADAVEAAGRTLTDPTPARIQGMVQKIINNIFIDGQLDECELTLKDLHNIAKSFNRILSGIFHHRIDYPEPVHKERKEDAVKKEQSKRKNGDDSSGEQAKEAKDRGNDPKKGSAEDLKRLGMS